MLIALSIIGIGITDYGNTLSAVRMGDEKVMNDQIISERMDLQ